MSTPAEDAEVLLAAPDEAQRVRGVRLLRDAVEPRGRAARRLVAVLADPGRYVPHAARAALQTLGDDAVEALLEGLTSPHAALRTGSSWALARPQGARADDVADALARLIDDPDATVRDAVAGALGRVGSAATVTSERLSALARDVDPRVRVGALRSLGLRPELAAAGRHALLAALDDGRTAVRLAAAEGLHALAPDGLDAALRARVREVLEDEPDGPVTAPLRALLEIGGSAG